ncbi:MAG: type IV secretion system protein, partial [Chloroflexi bacterium]|nr:type IV secretion system protein [Chloroflexota bacterium]
MKRINWVRWLVLACTIGILGSMSLIPRLVAAQGPTPEMWTTGPNGEQIPWNTPGGAQPSGPAQTTPVPGGDPGGGWQLPDVVGTITQIIRHILVFPAKSLQETLEQAVAATLKDNVEYMRHPLEEALYLTIFSTPTLRGTPTAASQGFAGLWVGTNPFEDVWYKVRLVSFFLYPILLAITGLSITSRNALGASWQGEDLGEALVRWFFIVLASGLSLYLCDWINRLCNALAGLFLGMPDATFIVNAVFMGASSVLIVGGGPVLGLLLGVFMFVVGLLIIVALIMQYVARYVLLYILVAIAPLAILALGLDQTRWLGFLWIKGFLMVTLLQPISALVFALMYLLAQNGVLNGLADPVGSFVKFAVVVGLLSVLITLNYAVINGVFGAIGQVMAQGKNTAMGVASLMGRTLTVGLTAVAGIAGGGAVAGGGGAAAMTGSGGGATTGG